MKATRWLFACGVVLGFWINAQEAPCEDAKGDSRRTVIRVRGSLPLTDAVDRFGKAFTQEHPDSVVNVAGGGIKAAFESLSEHVTDIVMAGRKARPSETAVATRKGVQLEERLIGSTAVIVVVNPSLPVTRLTLEQLKKIYTGEIDRWNQVGGPDALIEPYSLPDNPRGTAGWFRTRVLESAEFGSRTEFLAEPVQLITRVASSPAGIGYTGSVALEDAVSANTQLKVTMVGLAADSGTAAVLPSPETLADMTYPLIRSLLFYWDTRSSKKSVPALVDFCTTRAAQLQ
jgi:phosphate transport system substrate-binding protein